MSAVDDYIARFPDDVRAILTAVRRAIHAGVPDATEQIRYGMPAVMLGGRYALHFAGWKNHVSLYPVPRGDEEFEQLVGPYRSTKDSVTLLYSKPLPVELITRIAEECAEQHG
ncbi:iron chaperone [Microcella flavibacter]|uniref:iron chaperone n=1 Tax=Microcella flavibacter TaxID=1804990 RepID=UPI001456C9C3|nr:DUF1801 domain-containing protein [Microcella flavibacter]